MQASGNIMDKKKSIIIFIYELIRRRIQLHVNNGITW